MEILIWLGSGFAFSVGICLGAGAMRFLSRHPRENEAIRVNSDSLKQLSERNEIGREQVKYLGMIAEWVAAQKSRS